MRLRPFHLGLLACLLIACSSSPPRDPGRLYEKGQEQDAERDVEYAQTVHELLAEGEIRSDEDRLYAAAVLMRTERLEDLRLAEELALKAASNGDERGFRLAAEAIDRSCLVLGVPQKYATQYLYSPVTKNWALHTWDPSTTDAERAAMGVPSLAEALARLKVLNGPDGPQP